MPSGSLKGRLFTGIVAAMAFVTLLGGSLTYILFRSQLLQALDHSLLDKMRFLEAACVQRGRRIAFVMQEEAWLRIHSTEDPEYFQFRFRSGRTILRSRSLQGADLPMPGSDSPAPVFTDVTLPGGRMGRCIGIAFTPADREGSSEPLTVHLAVAHERGRVDAALADLRNLLLQIGLLSTAFVALAAHLVLRRQLRPLRDLEAQIDARPPAETAKRFALHGAPRELHSVVQRLNQLMERVEETLEREKQFTANAAHELRNPLAAMRTQVELALLRPRAPEDYQATLRELLDAELRMQQAVEHLLMLARLESPETAAATTEIILPDFLRRCWKPHFDAAETRKIRVQWSCPSEAPPFRTPAALLEVVVQNLFGNAVAHCPESGLIRITARIEQGRLQLQVANTNPGLAADDIPRLFRRFWRGSVETEPQRGELHAGIGLGLCRRIAAVLRGEIEAGLEDGLFRVTLRVPDASGA